MASDRFDDTRGSESPQERDWFEEYLGSATPPANAETARQGLWQPPETGDLDYLIDPNPPWAIGPCIRPGDCAYIVGMDGVGKSSFLAEIARVCATPGDLLEQGELFKGIWHVNPDHAGRVLIVNAETSGRDDWNRFIRGNLIGSGLKAYSSDASRILQRITFVDQQSLEMWGETREANTKRFAEWVIREDFKLVILDPVFNVFAPDDLADANWVNFGLRTLIQRLKPAGIVTLAIAHPAGDAQRTGKARVSLDRAFTPFGTSQQRGMMDARFGLRRNPDDPNRLQILVFKNRRAGWIRPKTSFELTLGTVGGYKAATGGHHWPYECPDPVPMSETAQDILDKLPANQPFDTKLLTEKLKIRKKTWEENRDAYFFPLGLVEGEQMAAKGAPWLYHLTALGVYAKRNGKSTT